MKYLLGLLFVTAGITTYLASPAYCWGCTPKECQFSITCGIGCYCHKGSFDITGICVSE